MPRRSRMSRVEGLDHPEYAKSYYTRAEKFSNAGEKHLADGEKMLKRIDKKMNV